ncbi:hypothetical protein LCGC14_0900600 [marine sediment metagenome]|uniref:Uncharacterized protein n=1 Tax=marine sediment metagenome TaxID=412755 RepID=A0A0F9S3I1_9ZZZZ
MAKKQTKQQEEEIEIEELTEDELSDLEEIEEALEEVAETEDEDEVLEEEDLEEEVLEEEDIEIPEEKPKKKKAPAKKKVPEIKLSDLKIGSILQDLHGKKIKVTKELVEQMKVFEKANPKSHAVWKGKVTGVFLYFKYYEDNPVEKKAAPKKAAPKKAAPKKAKK